MDRIHLTPRSISPVRVSVVGFCWPEKRDFCTLQGLNQPHTKGHGVLRFFASPVKLSMYHQAQLWKDTGFMSEVTEAKEVECCRMMIGSPEISIIYVK